MQIQDSTSVASASSTSKASSKDSLGKDDFMQILITQLQNQDPLNPMEDRDFIAQVAQFSSLEKTEEMNDSMSQLKALEMIGKQVYATKTDELTSHSYDVDGLVKSVAFSGDRMLLDLGEESVYMDKVKEIGYE